MRATAIDVYGRNNSTLIERHTGPHFSLADGRAEWSSADHSQGRVIEQARIWIAGPHAATGVMTLHVAGWAHRLCQDGATYQFWRMPFSAQPNDTAEQQAEQPGTSPTTLRDLIAAADDEDPPAWHYADRCVTDRLGPALAQRVHWQEPVSEDGLLFGVLADDDTSIALRYEPESEPGNDRIWVRVPCPNQPDCPGPAWDVVTNRRELLQALDAGVVVEPWCEHDGDHR
jgi:hypothetical protein